jgi:tryptophan synthase alpha chain
MLPRDMIVERIRRAAGRGPALIAFLTAGFPTREQFWPVLGAIAGAADIVEIGVPFSDPMADGVTIQRSSRIALGQGVTLDWILDELHRLESPPAAPLLLMSYLNPLLSHGLASLAVDARQAGVSGFIVPDLPFEECAELRAALDEEGLALVQMITPVTPRDRMAVLCAESRGFVYAVTMTGTTGSNASIPDSLSDYLHQARALSPLPVCAGFGIRNAAQVARLAGHADGIINGSALVEVLERGEDPALFLSSLRR